MSTWKRRQNRLRLRKRILDANARKRASRHRRVALQSRNRGFYSTVTVSSADPSDLLRVISTSPGASCQKNLLSC